MSADRDEPRALVFFDDAKPAVDIAVRWAAFALGVALIACALALLA